MGKDKPPKIDMEQIKEAGEWLERHKAEVPPAISAVILQYLTLIAALSNSQQKVRGLLLQLRRALGITPSSEKNKHKSGDPCDVPKDLQSLLLEEKERHEKLEQWHRQLARKHKAKAKDIGNKMNVEDYDLSPEEEAAADKEAKEHTTRCQSGGGPDPKYQSPEEAMMRGGEATVVYDEDQAVLTKEQMSEGEVGKVFTEDRVRYDFSMEIRKISIEVQKAAVTKPDGSTGLVCASTLEFGPPKMKVTYDFLANMAIMASQYAMPLNRFATMVTSAEKKFSSGEMVRYFQYVAQRLLPVYIELSDQLAQAEVLSGDDTSVRVTEVKKAFDRLKSGEITQDKLPWHSYATIAAAKESKKKHSSAEKSEKKTLGLGVQIAEHLGFVSDRRNEEGVSKQRLQTTVVWGRSVASDPKSTTIFYRSHLGGFGNLLERLVEQRLPKNRDIVIQSDLSTVNLITDDKLTSKFNISYAGCTSHARRPFALYKDDDPDATSYMLHLFKGLYLKERGLDIYGRNYENISQVREHDCRGIWEDIKELSEKLTKKWSRETPLGDGARYIIRNYGKLTYYLNDPRVLICNNFSERMIRMEKLIEDNSMFRVSLEGRFALDICRTVFQTAIAAGAPLQEYITYLLRDPPEEVKNNPDQYTPYHYVTKKPETIN